MNSIKILPENLINKIAAGEVVERPASAVKELVENAVDAQARSITIAVKGGGKQSILVMDDGIGMGKDDALLAFERHATSKITTDSDLENIFSLGFRGEALPSIASVSRTTLTTSKNSLGTKIAIEGGKISHVKEVAFPQGTTMEVKNLFFNTPARAKFLKSTTTELGHISRTIIQQSLAHPEIYFKLQNNDRTIIDSPPAKDELKYKIAGLFGYDFINDLIEIQSKSETFSLSGLISKPSTTRATRENQYLFVNKRHVKDRTITHAISEAYSRILPNNRHPLTFLYLTINPDTVDVNVHPSKNEVRFLYQNSIHDFIKDALSMALYSKPASPVTFAPASKPETPFSKREKHTQIPLVEQNKKAKVQEAVATYLSTTAPDKHAPNLPAYEFRSIKKDEIKHTVETVSPQMCTHYNVLGQINNSFIVAENKEGMMIIDQHTAHERILYESFLKKIHSAQITVQSLLIPLTIELNKGEALVLQNNIATIEKTGIEIEPFGPTTFIIRAVPSLIVGQDYQKVVMDMVDTLSQYGEMTSFEDMLKKIVTSMACHAAVKAHQRLEQKEMKHLVDQLGDSNIPHTCPHGRPIVLLFSLRDIEKKFMR